MKRIFNFKKDNGDIKIGKIILFSCLGFFTFIFIACSFTIVESGQVGLKIKFGKIQKVTIKEGLNIIDPFIESIVKVNIKVQKSELQVESSTKDMQIINTSIAVNYRVNSESVSDLYRTVGNSYDETILQPAIKESIKSAIAQYNAEEITTKRSEVSSNCLKSLQAKIAKYGIIIEDFNLTNFSFSSEYTKAIEEKQVAQQNLEKSKLTAEAKIIEAEAANKANELLRQNTTDEVLAKQFIEKWDGKLPETYAGQDIMGIFNLK